MVSECIFWLITVQSLAINVVNLIYYFKSLAAEKEVWQLHVNVHAEPPNETISLDYYSSWWCVRASETFMGCHWRLLFQTKLPALLMSSFSGWVFWYILLVWRSLAFRVPFHLVPQLLHLCSPYEKYCYTTWQQHNKTNKQMELTKRH